MFNPARAITFDLPERPNAVFISQNIPSTLVTGQKTTVSITMKNTGNTPWGNGDYGYKLGSQNPRDNITWGYGRMYLQQASVAQGEQTTFTYSITAPSTPGTYNFQWQMVDDGGNGWFGPLTPNVVITVSTPTPTPTPSQTPTPTPSKTPTPTPITCGIPQMAGRSLFVFPSPDHHYLLANGSNPQAIVGPYNFNLVAGTYRVTLLGYDDHSEHPSQYQPNEQFQVVLKRMYESRLATSNASADIADNAKYSPVQVVGNITIDQDATTITAIHAAYPNSNPNSVAPVCAAFDLISTPTPSVNPAPAINVVKTANVSNLPYGGGNVTYGYTVTNPGNVTLSNVTLTDNKCSNVNRNGGDSNGNNQLETNESWVYSCSTNITQTTTNIATASGKYGNATVTDTDSRTVTVDQPGNLVCAPSSQTKQVNQTVSVSATGGTGTYSWSAPGATTSSGSGTNFSTTYTTTGGKTITLTSGNQTATCGVAVTAIPAPAIEVVKNASVTSLPPNGGDVAYTYSVRNTGNVSLMSIQLTDNKCSPVTRTTGDTNNNNILETSEIWSYTCSSHLTSTTTNTATVTATDGSTNVSDTDSKTVTVDNTSITAPTANAYCADTTSKATITWSAANRGANGYYVDIDNDSDWSNGFWNKFVSTTTSTTAPDSFVSMGGAPALTLVGNASYRIRVFYAQTGEHSPIATFTASNCNVIGNPQLAITKLVRNYSAGGNDADSITVHPGDSVEFSIRVQNTGNANATNVRINDVLPSGLTFQNNTSTYGDGVISGWINVGSLTPGQSITVRFRATVREDSYFSSSSTRLTNYAYTNADSVGTISDTANVDVTKSVQNNLSCTPSYQTVSINQTAYFNAFGGNGNYAWTAYNATNIYGSGSSFNTRYSGFGTNDVVVRDSNGQTATCRVQVTGDATSNLAISKMVRNVTTGSGESEFVSAISGNTVEFILRVTTIGNFVQNIRVSDSLPSGLVYIGGSTRIDNNYAGDGITSGGISLGTSFGYRTYTVSFQATVSNSTPCTAYYCTSNGTTLTNTAYASADNTSMVSDTAQVGVNGTNGTIFPSGQLSITKLGRNISKGESSDSASIKAAPNDTIDFALRIRNTSTTTINNVIVRDVLPANFQYIYRSTSVNGIAIADDQLIGNGINIGSLQGGQEVVVRYSAAVRDAYAFAKGVTSLTNLAFVRGDSIGETSAQLPIAIYNGSVLGTIGGIKTGASGLFALWIVLSVLLTIFYMAYTSTGFFKKRQAWNIMSKNRADKNKFNFA